MNEDWVFKRGDLYYANLNPYFGSERGDLYYANLNPYFGSEQGGTRPVLVLQNNMGNFFCPTLIVAPLTSKWIKKKELPVHYDLHIDNELVAEAFSALPQTEQSILILHCTLDLADGEIGNLVGMSRSAVQRHRTKALQELREALSALMPKGG